MNLSKHTLTPAQHTLLCRGLKFCPNPGEPDISTYQADLNNFHLRLKRYIHFSKPIRNEDDDIPQTPIVIAPNPDEPFKHQKFKNPSDWVPPPIVQLEFFISKNNLDLTECNLPKPSRNNISTEERQALKDLSNNKHIVIKPADKGGAVVILNREDYIEEGLRQLSDPNFYTQTPDDMTQQFHGEVVAILDDMFKQGQIDRSCYLYLSYDKIRTSQFYMLPKIHKKLHKPPGRPIVSGNGCPTERISQFLDHFLQPCVTQIRSYIKDTTHFLNMLNQLGTLPPNSILTTLDVSSLYTNIPNEEGMNATAIALDNSRGNNQHPSNTHLLFLLNKVLKCNNFDFDGKHFLQVGGTAMGTKVAPSYANTFMGWFEETHVYTYAQQPLLWKRFIDDIFVIWTHGQRELDTFVQHLNTCMPSIKFEAEASQTLVHFLDVNVHLDTEGVISTSQYTKDTDSHNYIDFLSCHPKHCKNGIPYGQFLRLRRICSSIHGFIEQSKIMAGHFLRANYPPKLVQTSFERAYLQDRNTLLTSSKEKTNAQDSLFLVTTFHPTFRAVNDIVSLNMDLLDRSSSTRSALQANLIRGFRRCRNLRDHLVRAALPPPPPENGVNTPPLHDNTCRREFCLYCNKLNRSGNITSVLNNRRYRTRTNVSCRCTNIIYAIKCLRCGKIYVGQTKRRLMDRLMEHFRNIRQQCRTHIVGRHYTSNTHEGVDDVEVFVLEFISAHPDSAKATHLRDTMERKWIFRLRSLVPTGLNLFE